MNECGKPLLPSFLLWQPLIFFSSQTRMRHCWPIWWVYRFETWTKTVTFIIFQNNSASLFLDHFGKSAASFIFWFQFVFFSNKNNGVKYCKHTKLLTKFPCAPVDIRLASVQNLKLQGFSLKVTPGHAPWLGAVVWASITCHLRTPKGFCQISLFYTLTFCWLLLNTWMKQHQFSVSRIFFGW